MATPSGEQAIGSLEVGDTVLAYNPTTGKTEPEPVLLLWRNHPPDLVTVQPTTVGMGYDTCAAHVAPQPAQAAFAATDP